MWATLLGLILGGLLIFLSRDGGWVNQEILQEFRWVMVAASLTLLILSQMTQSILATSISKGKKLLGPNLVSLFKSSPLFFLFQIFPAIFFILTLGLILFLPAYHLELVAIWLVLLGITLDLIYQAIKRGWDYSDPLNVLERLGKKAEDDFPLSKSSDLIKTHETLFDIALLSLRRGELLLSSEAIKKATESLISYLQYHHQKNTGKEGLEKVGFVLFSSLQRMKVVFHQALDLRDETVPGEILIDLGKLALVGAEMGPEISVPSIKTLGELTLEAKDLGLEDLSVKGSVTLDEIGKGILKHPRFMFLKIDDIFISLISEMEKVSKLTFTQNKGISIDYLTEPFRNLKLGLEQEPVKNHPHAPIIQLELDRVLGEFEALGLVLRTLPNIPGLPEETEQNP